MSVKEPLSYLVLSNTIRAAVVAWAKSLATEVGPFNITVNSILTGYFDTERLSELNQKKAEQQKHTGLRSKRTYEGPGTA